MLYRLKKDNMQHLQQSVCKSVENYDESSRQVIAREVLEETGLEVILGDLQYLFNDLEYDCNIYKLKIYLQTELNQSSKGNGNISPRMLMKKQFEIVRQP